MYTVSTNEIAIILIVYTIMLVYVLWDRKYNHLESKTELDDITDKPSVELNTIYDDNIYRRMVRSRDTIKNSNNELNTMTLKHLSLITKLSDLAKHILNNIKIYKGDLELYLKVLAFSNKLKTLVLEDSVLDMLLEDDTELLNIIPLGFNDMREVVFMDEKHSSKRSILANPNSSVELRSHHRPSYSSANYILFIKCKNKQVFGLHLWLDIKNDILKVYPTKYIYTENNWYIAMDIVSNDRFLELLERGYDDRLESIKTISSGNVKRVEVMDIDNDDSTLIPISIHIINHSL